MPIVCSVKIKQTENYYVGPLRDLTLTSGCMAIGTPRHPTPFQLNDDDLR